MTRLLQALFSLTTKTLYALGLGFIASAFVLLWYELGERKLTEPQPSAIAEVPSSGVRASQTKMTARIAEAPVKDAQPSVIGSAWMQAGASPPAASSTGPEPLAKKPAPSSTVPVTRPDPWRLPPIGRYIPRSGAEL